MIQVKDTQDPSRVVVTFSLPISDELVSVVGDFNNWDPAANPLESAGDIKATAIELDSGRRYEFRYLGEFGRWFNDDCHSEFTENGHGESNGCLDLSSVLRLDVELTTTATVRTRARRKAKTSS